MITFHPLNPERWADFEKLLSPRGACGGFWCMYWHQTQAELDKQHGEPNRISIRACVDFRQAGFTEVLHRSETRLIMRYDLRTHHPQRS